MSNPLNFKARRRERERAARLLAMTEHRNELRRHLFGALDLVGQTEAQVAAELATNVEDLRGAVDASIRPELGEWSLDAWGNWRADTTTSIEELRVGSLVGPAGERLGVPVVLELSAAAGPIVIVSRTTEQRLQARELLGSLTVRLTACFPKQLRLALIDPADAGSTFPMSRRLDRVLLGFEDVHHALDELRSDTARIRSMYLDRHHPTFDSLPTALRLGETRQVALVASAPAGLDDAAVDSLVELAEQGPTAGIHAVVHVDLERGEGAESLLERLVALGATVLDLGGTEVTTEGLSGTVEFDLLPPGTVQEIVFQRVAAAPRRDVLIPWDSLQEADPDGYWQELSDTLMTTAVGRAGADEIYDLWFGTDPDSGRACTHGIVFGAAPTGRQFVFDNLLGGLTTQLSPNELRVFLVEGRDHASFAPWRNLPHAEVIAMAPSPEQARHALAELRAIVERRQAELQRSGYATYRGRREDGSLPTIPRWLAIIDSYEQLFADDTDDRAVADLQFVVEHGERAGVHLMLGAARFDTAGALHRAGLFDRLDLRISLQPFADDALGRDEFGLKGARLVQRVCDRPFRVVVNSNRGHDDANLAMQLACLDPNRRDELIADLAELGRAERLVGHGPQIVNGAEQPQLIDNPLLQQLIELPRAADSLAEWARTSAANGGLGIEDWIDEEHPLLMFIGQEETLRGQAHFVLRRRPTENVLVVMADRDLRVGTLAALLVSSALVDPEDVEFWIADRGPAETRSGEALEHAVRRIARLDVPCRYTRSGDEGADFIGAVAAEVARRRTLSERELHTLPSSFLVLVEPERIAALNRIPTAQGTTDSEVGLQLRYVLMQGPAVGVHAIVVASAMAALTTVVAEPVVHHDLRHRIVTRVAEEDSFALVRSSKAATLHAGNGHAAAAVLFDSHTQLSTTFKPYSVNGSETGRAGPMSAQLTSLFDRLTEEVPS